MRKEYDELLDEFKKCNRDGMIKRYRMLLMVYEIYDDLVQRYVIEKEGESVNVQCENKEIQRS